MATLLVWMGAHGVAAAQETRLLAQQRFDDGMAHFEGGRFDDAVAAFRDAYAALPSPNSRLMLARSLERAGRLGEAFAELEFVVREATDRASLDERFVRTLEAATVDRDALMPRIGWLTVHLSHALDDGELSFDGRTFSSSIAEVRVPVTPGALEVHLRAPEREAVSGRVVVAAGADASVRLEVPPRHPSSEPIAETEPMPSTPAAPAIAPWIIASLGAVGLGVGVGLSVHAQSLHDGAVGAPSMRDAFALQASAEDMALATNVTLGVAGATLLLGTLWGSIDLATLWGSPPRD